MGHAEDLVKLRTRMLDAVRTGVVGEDADTFKMTLIQILNEAEKKRQKAEAGIENLRRQVHMMEGQVNAYSQIGSILYAVLDGYVKLAEKTVAEEQAREAERAESGKDDPPAPKAREDMTPAEKRADTRAKKKAAAAKEASG